MKISVARFLGLCKKYKVVPFGKIRLYKKKGFGYQYIYRGDDIKKLFFRTYLKGNQNEKNQEGKKSGGAKGKKNEDSKTSNDAKILTP